MASLRLRNENIMVSIPDTTILTQSASIGDAELLAKVEMRGEEELNTRRNKEIGGTVATAVSDGITAALGMIVAKTEGNPGSEAAKRGTFTGGCVRQLRRRASGESEPKARGRSPTAREKAPEPPDVAHVAQLACANIVGPMLQGDMCACATRECQHCWRAWARRCCWLLPHTPGEGRRATVVAPGTG